MKIEVNHHLNADYPNGVEKTVKTWKLFGIVIKQKTYHYPKLNSYEVVSSF